MRNWWWRYVHSDLICIILLCLNFFSNIKQQLFVSYEAWTRLITVRVKFKVIVFVIHFCYASVMILLCFFYASYIILLWWFYFFIVLLLYFHSNHRKKYDDSESISTPHTKINKHLVEKEEDKNRVAIGMMIVCVQLFNDCFVYYCMICIIFLCLNFSVTYNNYFLSGTKPEIVWLHFLCSSKLLCLWYMYVILLLCF